MCHQPLNSNIISRVMPLQTTVQFDLWPAGDSVEHCMDIYHMDICCMAILFMAGCTVALVSSKVFDQ